MKKSFLILGAAAVVFMTSCEQGAKEATLESSLDSVSYAMGVSIGNNLLQSKVDSINTAAFENGLKAAIEKGDLKISVEEGQQVINNYFQNLGKAQSQASQNKGKVFLEENKTKEGVQVTASGLQYKVLQEGNGAKPTLDDVVTTHYHGTLIDGTVFDSSVDRGEPTSFPLNGVIPGWQEGLQLMPVGSKYRFFIPSNLAYGERGAGGMIGPNETLVFDVELISIEGK